MKKAYRLDAQRRKGESARLAYSTDSGFGQDYLKRNSSQITLPETQYAARQWEADRNLTDRRRFELYGDPSILSICYPADVRELLDAEENPKDGSRSVFHEYDRHLALSRPGKTGPMMFTFSIYDSYEDGYVHCACSLYELIEYVERAKDRMEKLTDLHPAESERLLRRFISVLFDMPDYREPDLSARPVLVSPKKTRIAPLAFYCRTDVSSAELPGSIAQIEKMAFAGCTRLQSVNLPGVKVLGEGAFAYCRSLKTIVIPEGVTHIPDSCFKRCTSLETIVLPESVVSIGANAFEGCTALTQLRLPEGLKSIGADAFGGCVQLRSIALPDGVVSVPGGAFKDCLSLQSVSLPESVLSIGNRAFAACSALESIALPAQLESIGGHAFEGCLSLRSADLPDSVTSVGNSAFAACGGLESVRLPDRLERISDHLFSRCAHLKSLSLPLGLHDIGALSFFCCTSLDSISLPDGVQRIDPSAFEECELHTVNLAARHFSVFGADELIGHADSVRCIAPIGALPAEHQRRAFIGFVENEALYPHEIRSGYLAYLHDHAAELTRYAQYHPGLFGMLRREGLIAEE